MEKVKSQFQMIIKLSIAFVCILMLCAGMMNDSNKLKVKPLKADIDPIISLQDLGLENYEIDSTSLNKLIVQSKEVGKSYNLSLTGETSSLELNIYQFNDQTILNKQFEDIVSNTYTRFMKIEKNCIGNCVMPKVKYEVAIENFQKGNEELWHTDEVYEIMNDQYQNQLDHFVILRKDNKMVTIEIQGPITLETKRIQTIRECFEHLDLNQL